MDVRESFEKLHGEWAGKNEVWLHPGAPVRESDTMMRIGAAAMGRFVTLDYIWADEGKPQAGLILLGLGEGGEGLKAAWVDAWHNQDRMMMLEGEMRADGTAAVTGSYTAGESPPWGWRIELPTADNDSFEMRMYNITPEGLEALAVKAVYVRKA
jgi:hypothetical protein